MILAVVETKVRAWIHTEFGAKPSVRGLVVFVVCLAEVGVIGQRVYSLESAHLEQNSPCYEVDVEEVKGAELQIPSQKQPGQNLPRDATARCCSPQREVQLLWPKNHV